MTVIQKSALTPAEKRALKAFRIARRKAGVWPSMDEVAAELGQTKQNAEILLRRLAGKGRLVKAGRYRGYREPARRAVA
jgi:predicted transcriptional regulator